MKGIVPYKLSDQIDFYQAHITLWTTNKLALGFTDAQLAAMTTALNGVKTKLQNADDKRLQSKIATNELKVAQKNLLSHGAQLISAIRAKGETDPNAFNLGGVPPPGTPVPSPPPTNVTNVDLYLNSAGDTVLTWTCTAQNGAFMSVWRQLNNAGDFELIGSVGSSIKKFLDGSLPADTNMVSYVVRSHKGDQISAGSEPVTLYLHSLAKAA